MDLRSVHSDYAEVEPYFLLIHASLAKVLHASGAGEAIDKILEEWEKTAVLSQDGRDAELLLARLSLVSHGRSPEHHMGGSMAGVC